MNRLFLVLLLSLTISCNDSIKSSPGLTNRDTIMKNYFAVIDSLPFKDTLDQKSKLLKAYHDNDTIYLKKKYNEIAGLLKYKDQMIKERICNTPPEINSLQFEEAYRFIYSQAFCNNSVVITIGKRRDSIIMNFIMYEFYDEQPICNIVNHFEKNLKNENWESLLTRIGYADFWGLSDDNGRHGTDGSSLTVTGYQRPINAFEGKYKKVYRWASEESAIGDAFKHALSLSGIKINCFRF